MYKLNENSVQRLSDNASIPLAVGNRDYQELLDWINEGNTPTGPDVIEPDYVALRTGPDGYAPIHEQLAMQTDGTWDAHVADVKTRFPKSNTGSTSIGDVPQGLLDAAANKLFAQQVEAYKDSESSRSAVSTLCRCTRVYSNYYYWNARVERRSWRDARCYRNEL